MRLLGGPAHPLVGALAVRCQLSIPLLLLLLGYGRRKVAPRWLESVALVLQVLLPGKSVRPLLRGMPVLRHLLLLPWLRGMPVLRHLLLLP